MGRTELRADPLIGTVIDDRYRVLSPVASGGMGTVYRADDMRLDRVVALKVMHSELASEPGFVARFAREARAAGRLSDLHVVGVFDQGSDGDLVWLAMDYVRGFSLRQVISAHAPLDPDRALGVVEQILSGLGAAHAAGFLHGDVKPENVLMTSDGTMKLTDFGLVRAALGEAIDANGAAVDARIVGGADGTADMTAVDSASDMGAGGSSSSALLGTAAYVAPELVTAGVSDQRSDIYATGIVLYELLTGRLPFEGSSVRAVANRRVQEDVPPPSLVVPGIPAVVDALVARATARDPEGRFVSVSEFLEAARAIEIAGDSDDRATIAGPETRPADADRSISVQRQSVGSLEVASATTSVFGATHGPTTTPVSATTAGYGLTESRTTILGLTGNATTVLGQAGAPTAVFNGHSGGAHETRWHESRWDEHGWDGSDWMPPADPAWAGRPIRSASRFGRTRAVVILTALAAVMAVLGWWLGGSAGVPVPDVAGQTATEAQVVLAGAGVENTEVAEEFDATTPAGVVLGTVPPSGTVVTRDGGVTLIVSKGPEPVVVPNLIGQAVDEAASALESLGLGVETRGQLPFVVLNRVVGQDIDAGSSVPPGTTVTLRLI